MLYGMLANAVLVAHLAFVLFVIFGGLLALRWRRMVWLHLPALVWGVAIELLYLPCPLTGLENDLRRRSGEAGYEGDFVEHYVTLLLYPGVGREVQFVLGLVLVAVNAAVYGFLMRRRAARRSDEVRGARKSNHGSHG